MMKQTVLLFLLAAASIDASSSHLRHRELWDSSSSGSGWSFWGSVLQLLDNMHTPCPPGDLHHKDSDGEPLPPGECWQDLHPSHHHHHSSHTSQSSGSSSSSVVNCEEGDAGCDQNIRCKDDNDADCIQYMKCPDDDVDCKESADDRHSVDDLNPIEYDDGWSDDGWTNSYSYKGGQDSGSIPIWPFSVAALVAGVIGVALVVSRRKKRAEMIEHDAVTSSTTSWRKRLFSGFNRKKQGTLNADFDNDDNYVKMSH